MCDSYTRQRVDFGRGQVTGDINILGQQLQFIGVKVGGGGDDDVLAAVAQGVGGHGLPLQLP